MQNISKCLALTNLKVSGVQPPSSKYVKKNQAIAVKVSAV